MERRNFLVGIGGVSIGGSALLGTGAFSRVESQRDVTIAVAEDPDAYLGLKPLDTPNSQNYVALDDNGHLYVQIDGEGDQQGIGTDGPDGQGVNSDSRTWFDGMFQICNQGKEDACVSWEFGDNFQMRDDAELVFYYDGDTDGDSSTSGRVDIEEGREVPVPVGECATIGLRTETFDVDATDDDPLFSGDITLIADVEGDCFDTETPGLGCVECTAEAGDGSEDFLTIEGIDDSSYPEIEATARIDTDAGRNGDLDESNFTVCETFGGDDFGQTPSVTFAGEDEDAEADVMLVIDTSGSMGGQKLTDAQNGAKALVDTLGPGVNVGLVEFASSATLVQGLTSDKQTVKDAIDGLSAGGGTDVGDGIDEGQAEIDANGRPGVPKFMVVLGNGDTSGGENPATNAKNAGTTIYGIAYGSGASAGDFEDIAGEVPNDPDWEEFAFDADQDDITVIFEDIGGIISGTYSIEYTTCNPDTDGSGRDVLVYVDDPEEGDADETVSYTAPSS